MNARAPINGKIAKFLRLLGSDQDREVLAAVRALRNTLKSAGSDLHALAQIIELSTASGPPMTEAEMKKLFDAGFAKGHNAGFQEGIEAAKRDSRAVGFRNTGDVDWGAMAQWCFESPRYRLLGLKHQHFIEGMTELAEEEELSAKQKSYLLSMLRQLGGRPEMFS
jgi:hypothetical protein